MPRFDWGDSNKGKEGSLVDLNSYRSEGRSRRTSTQELKDFIKKKEAEGTLGKENPIPGTNLVASDAISFDTKPKSKPVAIIRRMRKAGKRLRGDLIVDDELRSRVAMMVVSGASLQNIARVLCINPQTLRKYFADEIDCIPTVQNSMVADTCFEMATSGKNIAATIFWLKARAGWRDQPEAVPTVATSNVQVIIGGVDADL